MRSLISLFLLLAFSLSSYQPVHAQKIGLPVNNLGVTYNFGLNIIFQAQLVLPSPKTEAYLFFRADGEDATHILPIQLDDQGNSFLRYDMTDGMVRPFSIVRYHYRVKLTTGEEVSSDEFTFRYEDNRFAWQMLSDNNLTVHWYNGDLSFGQAALDVARRGIQKINDLLLVTLDEPVNIYLYADTVAQSSALEMGGLSLVGGHASPDLRLVLASIAPGPEQGLEMDRKIPHELAHVLTYDLMGARYKFLPIWLQEGIAAQVELSANPDYPLVLAQASGKKALFPINDLCGAFPPEAGRLFLAYAESESFTHYIIVKFGQTGLLALTNAYGDGLDCEQGMQQALGKQLTQVELQWRASVLGQDTLLVAFQNLFPYIAILGLLLMVSLIGAFTTRRSKNG